MRQHPIPQNILDVEFKLFTKFTLKEFGYLALGIGSGGIFLYLSASGYLPGIIGIPVFIVCSLAGIILGLVPINDQDADVFIKNYITAISSPTQRVWMNKEIKDSNIKPEVKPTQDGKIIHKESKESKKKIIGGNLLGEANEPQENLSNPEEEITNVTNTESKEVIQSEIIPETKATQPIDPNLLVITEENVDNYQFDIKTIDQLPGNINAWLCTKDFKQIPNVISYLRNNDSKILYANKTGPNGYFLTNKIWEEGVYTIEFQHPQFKFPKVKIVLTKNFTKKPIKITTL